MFSLASPKEEFLISSHERRWRGYWPGYGWRQCTGRESFKDA